jgi:hypothetical protein
MKQFLEALAMTFPDHDEICLFQTMFDDLVKTNHRKPVDLFMNALQPYSDLVMKKDNALFEQPISLGNKIDLSALWKENLSDSSRDAIWKYIHTLFLLGTTVRTLSPELLTTIDGIAQNCADKIKSGNADLSTITQSLLQGDILQGIGEENMQQLEGMATQMMPMLMSQLGGMGGGANAAASTNAMSSIQSLLEGLHDDEDL